MGAVLWLSSIGFSAVHTSAWGEAFPTAAEAWLWRVAALYIAFSGCLWAGIHVLAQASGPLWWLWYDFLVGEVPRPARWAVGALCACCGVAYVMSRLFLIVDSFVGLRSLPAASFLVPQWTVSLPHVG